MRYDGHTGIILLEGTDLVWLRQGAVAKLNRLPRRRHVPLADVTGALLTPATRLERGLRGSVQGRWQGCITPHLGDK